MLAALLAVLLLLGPTPAADVSHASVTFDTTTLTLTTDKLRMVLSPQGKILQLVDLPSSTSLLPSDGTISCLWTVVYADPITGNQIDNRGGCSGGVTLARPISQSWDAAGRRLDLTYRWNGASGESVLTLTLTVTTESALDVKVTSLDNRFGKPIRDVQLLSHFLFVDDDVHDVYAPFRLPGVRFYREFFLNRLKSCKHIRTYPGGDVFADYVHLVLGQGQLAIYAVNPDDGDRPLPVTMGFQDEPHDAPNIPDCKPTTIGDGHPRFFTYHSYQVWVPDGQVWDRHPTVRLQVGESYWDTLADYRAANGIAGFDSAAAKLGGLAGRVFSSPLVKVDIQFSGTPFASQTWRNGFDSFPGPVLLHPAAYMAGGHDHSYPAFLPPDVCWRSPGVNDSRDFAGWAAAARARGHLVMPYTNPMWWDSRTSTNAAIADSVAAKDLDGSRVERPFPAHNLQPAPGCQPTNTPSGQDPPDQLGFLVSPKHTDVHTILATAMSRWKPGPAETNVPVDLVFEDMIGAEAFRHDANPADPSRVGYSDGWLDHARTYRDQVLMTERGWDRLARYLAGFHGTLLDLQAKPEDRYGEWYWGGDTWTPFPLALPIFHDKVLTYQHDLSPEMMVIGGPIADPAEAAARPDQNRRILMWNLAFGQMLSYHWRWDWQQHAPIDETIDTRWLDLVVLLQRHVAAGYAGAPLQAFRELAPGNPHVTVFETAFSRADSADPAEYIQIISNWHATNRQRVPADPNTPLQHDLSPYGYLAQRVDGTVLAGSFRNTFNFHSLSPGDHHLVIWRLGDVVSVRQPIGDNTDLYVDPPPGVQHDLIRVRAINRAGLQVKEIIPTWEGPYIKLTYTRRLDGQVNGTELVGYDIGPRENVGVGVVRQAGALSATFTARPSCGQITSITFGTPGQPFNNARVSVTSPGGGPAGQTTGFVYMPGVPTTSVSIAIARVVPVGGALVNPISIADGCAPPWRTFVGGGPSAFP